MDQQQLIEKLRGTGAHVFTWQDIDNDIQKNVKALRESSILNRIFYTLNPESTRHRAVKEVFRRLKNQIDPPPYLVLTIPSLENIQNKPYIPVEFIQVFKDVIYFPINHSKPSYKNEVINIMKNLKKRKYVYVIYPQSYQTEDKIDRFYDAINSIVSDLIQRYKRFYQDSLKVYYILK
ncbi:MAG: hypothetical protein NZ908_02335 [Candidatus Micrarchaeota archaeon]|nr:hypothetical protein [Candidatus Micrarchaeota archaeon]